MIALLKDLQRVAALLLVIVATLLVYWPAQFNGFVWDDTALVLRDPLIRSWRLIPEGFRHFLFIDATASDFYRPIQRLSFTLDYAIWEFFPKGYHLTNVYLHIGAAVALFFLVERWPGRSPPWLSGTVALLWAVHPLHSSAVTYISGRADPLAALFGFSALTLALITLERRRFSGLATAGAAVCFLAALLSKESAAATLLVWFVILLWLRTNRALFLRWTFLAAIVIAFYAGLRFSAHRVEPPRDLPTALAARPVLAARALAEYTALFFAPINLRMERDVSTVPQRTPELTAQNARWREYQTLLGLAVLALFVIWFGWARRHAQEAALALVSAFVAYLPISNLFSLNATAAEHWLYLPTAFLLLAAARSLQQLAVRVMAPDSPPPIGSAPLPIRYRSFGVAALCILGVWTAWLGMRTWRRNADWKDQISFFTQTIAAGGDTARMHVNLGTWEASRGQDQLARDHFRNALARDPEQPIALLGLAAESIRLGDYPTARAALDHAAKFPHIAAEVAQLRGALEFRESGTDATPAMKAAAAVAPLNWSFRKRYLAALMQTGKLDVAARELRAFLADQPFRGDSWKMLGEMLGQMRQPAAAARAFEEAARRDVHDRESLQRAHIFRQLAER